MYDQIMNRDFNVHFRKDNSARQLVLGIMSGVGAKIFINRRIIVTSNYWSQDQWFTKEIPGGL